MRQSAETAQLPKFREGRHLSCTVRSGGRSLSGGIVTNEKKQAAGSIEWTRPLTTGHLVNGLGGRRFLASEGRRRADGHL